MRRKRLRRAAARRCPTTICCRLSATKPYGDSVKALLIPVTPDAAEDIKAGRPPVGHAVAADYPTEFSLGIAQSVGHEGNVGPFFVARAEDELVVGEIGGRFTEPGVVEIGYAIVPSYWGAGLATAAV